MYIDNNADRHDVDKEIKEREDAKQNLARVKQKFAKEKPAFDRIIPESTLGLACALANGNSKYPVDSWKDVAPEEYVGALHRHINAIQRGELFDADSGMMHHDHAAACLMILRWFACQDDTVAKKIAKNIANKTYIFKETK